MFADPRFERLAGRLSNGHLYDLRRCRAYRRQVGTKRGTRPTRVAIGERRRGQPGCSWVASVHQGDLAKVKGANHPNVVDEVKQYQFVGSVERISESYLLLVLESLLRAFPFRIQAFIPTESPPFWWARRDTEARLNDVDLLAVQASSPLDTSCTTGR